MDVDVLKKEILEYFANIPTTSPARYNHPYQYLHALFAWCAKQDYLPYNPFDKLELKKLKDEGNIKPATIEDNEKLFDHEPGELSIEGYKAIYDAIVTLSVDADGYGLFDNISDEDVEKCRWIAAIYEVLDDVPKRRMEHIFRHRKVEWNAPNSSGFWKSFRKGTRWWYVNLTALPEPPLRAFRLFGSCLKEVSEFIF